MEYKENKNKKVFNIDFDGTLTSGEYSDDPEPNHGTIIKVRELYYNGHVIIIWSARPWNNAKYIASWLIKHSVPFHGIFLGKGGADYYLDDHALTFKEFFEVEY